MNKKKGDDNLFMDFLKREKPEPDEILKGRNNERPDSEDLVAGYPIPTLVDSLPSDEEDLLAYWRKLRNFFRTGKGGGLPSGQSDRFLPLAMAGYRNIPYIENEYPVWMEGRLEEVSDLSLPPFSPVYQLLIMTGGALEGFEEQARILEANRYGLARIQWEMMKKETTTLTLHALLEKSFPVFLKKLDLPDRREEKFEEFLSRLLENLTWEGRVLNFSENVSGAILAAAIQSHQNRNRSVMEAEVRFLITQLRGILEVEQLNDPDADVAGNLQEAMNFVESHIDFFNLASVLPSADMQRMPAERLERLQTVLATLESVQEKIWDLSAILVLDHDNFSEGSERWKKMLPGIECQNARAGELCSSAMESFDGLMQSMALFFGAIRIAQLELDNNYHPDIHEEFFAHFDWQMFTAEEISVCPPVIMVSDETHLLQNELHHFSHMISTGKPIHTLALKKDARSGYTGVKGDEQIIIPQELGSFAISHRNTFVLQSTAVSPETLFNGFREGLQRHVPCVYHVLEHKQENGDAFVEYLWSSAAVESREFPGFLYDCSVGNRWGSRFSIYGNPAPEDDWPIHKIKYIAAEEGETSLSVAFTFADFAAQDADFREYFLPVPPQYRTEDLVPVNEYIQLGAGESYGKIPFIWMVDPAGHMHRVAVAWVIVQACQERLDNWNYLQENAGIRNIHAETAVERLRSEIEREYAAKMEELEARLTKEKEAVEKEAAGQAMQRLASFLLDMENLESLGTMTAAGTAGKAGTEQESAAAEAELATGKAAEEPEEEEDLDLGVEAWIETSLCTSCNECTNINDSIFQYNANKQAYVADPKGGPFRDIVEAAEECPASIIHPGSPQDPDEEGLEELIKRAEPFN